MGFCGRPQGSANLTVRVVDSMDSSALPYGGESLAVTPDRTILG